MKLGECIKYYRELNSMTQDDLAKQLGLSGKAVSTWENGTREPRMGKIEKLCEIFNISKSELLGESVSDVKITTRDERDISKKVTEILDDLQLEQGALMFDGEPMDDETRELLIASLENTARMAKMMAKKKYAPNKYKKE